MATWTLKGRHISFSQRSSVPLGLRRGKERKKKNTKKKDMMLRNQIVVLQWTVHFCLHAHSKEQPLEHYQIEEEQSFVV